MIDGENFFDQSINNNLKTYEILEKWLLVKEMIIQLVINWTIHISKIVIKMIVADLSKQQAYDADRKAI